MSLQILTIFLTVVTISFGCSYQEENVLPYDDTIFDNKNAPNYYNWDTGLVLFDRKNVSFLGKREIKLQRS